MKLGLRLQIVLLLGALMLLAFVPLFFAVATYASYTLRQLRSTHARALGESVAARVSEARAHRSTPDLQRLLDTRIGADGLESLAVFDAAGHAVAKAGSSASLRSIDPRALSERRAFVEIRGEHGSALLTRVTDDRGSVVAVLRTDDAANRAAPLIRLMGLYTGLVALGLLVMAYSALTRLIVRPLDGLSRAAQRVAEGARRLEVPRAGAYELAELGNSLNTMTERLLTEEESLRKKVEEVERATLSLQQAQERLVRSERLASVGRLAAGLAHEIGNPIAALIGFQDLLLAGGLGPEEERDFLQRMRRETERINRILRDLLQFARPGGVETARGLDPGDVKQAADDTLALLSPQRIAKQVQIVLDVAPDLPLVALSREQLTQVFLNLLLNAADASGPGGRVYLEARISPRGVRCIVEDTGPGVPLSIRDRLFEPFVTTKEVGKGTGLGLAVCRGLVEAAGGSIALDSAHAPGARFVLELPIAAQPVT